MKLSPAKWTCLKHDNKHVWAYIHNYSYIHRPTFPAHRSRHLLQTRPPHLWRSFCAEDRDSVARRIGRRRRRSAEGLTDLWTLNPFETNLLGDVQQCLQWTVISLWVMSCTVRFSLRKNHLTKQLEMSIFDSSRYDHWSSKYVSKGREMADVLLPKQIHLST